TGAPAALLRSLLAGSHPPREHPGLAAPPTPPCRDAWQRWQTRLMPSLRLIAEPPTAAPPPLSPPPPVPVRPVPSAPDAAPLAPVASLRAYYEGLKTRQRGRTWGR